MSETIEHADIEIGSVVAFKSGGVPMTVTDIDTSGATLMGVRITTVWMDSNEAVQRWQGPLAAVDVRRQRAPAEPA